MLHYLGPRDEPWLRALLEEYARFTGLLRADLQERLKAPLPTAAPRSKLRLAAQVLDRHLPQDSSAGPKARELRWRVFRAAASGDATRHQVLEAVASETGTTAISIEGALFADLAGESRVGSLPPDLSPSRLALLTNQALVHSFLKRAAHVRISAWGNTRALVRHARLLGLICVVSRANPKPPHAHNLDLDLDALPDSVERGVVLDISGPFVLFRKTEVYGRALASLLPRAARCHHFELEADCALGCGPALSKLSILPSDPIYPARELPAYDSGLEARFARDFSKLATNWDVIREPQPIDLGSSLLFPDFELVNRHDPQRRCLLEIVGFWTPLYLREKLQKLRAAKLERLVLCIDDRRRCSEADLPIDARVVRYKTRIDAKQVLATVDEVTAR